MYFYKYIYYKIYLSFKAIDDEMPSFLAMGFMCLLNAMNFVIVLGIILIYNPSIGYKLNNVGLITGLIVISFNTIFFLGNKRYRLIYKEFKNETKKRALIGTILVLAYIVFSLVLSLYMTKQMQLLYHPE